MVVAHQKEGETRVLVVLVPINLDSLKQLELMQARSLTY
jgi:hypothetical protein